MDDERSPAPPEAVGPGRQRGSRLPLAFLPVSLSLLLWPLAALHRVANSDIWWHLTAASWILDHGAVPAREFASWTAQGAPWYDYEWLWQLGALACWRAGDGAGLVLSTAFLAALTAWCLYLALREAGADPGLASALLWPALFTAWFRFQARPEMASLPLFALWLWLLLRARRKRRTGALWWLVPLTAVWANLHPGFLFGLGLLGLEWLGESLTWGRLRWRGEEVAAAAVLEERVVPLGLVTVGCGLASLLTPRPLGPHLLVLESLLGFRSLGLHNVEWEPMPLTPDSLPFWLLLLGTALLLVMDLPLATPADLLWLGTFGLLAVETQRSASLLAVVAPPLAARAIRHLQPRPPALASEGDPGRRRRGAALVHGSLGLAALLLVPAALRSPVAPAGFGVQWSRFPVEASSFLAREGAVGRMFNHYRLGGYLEYRFYPTRKIFADGKHIPYLPVLTRMEAAMRKGYPAFQRFLRDLGVEIAVLHYDEPLQPVVYGTDQATGRPRAGYRAWSSLWFHRDDWALVFWDDAALVKVRRRGADLFLERRFEYAHVDPEDWRWQLEQARAGRLDPGPILDDLQRKLDEDPGCRLARRLYAAFQDAARDVRTPGVPDRGVSP